MDGLELATWGLVTVTVALVATTAVYAYYTRKLAQHTAGHTELLSKQVPILRAQIGMMILQLNQQAQVGVTYPTQANIEKVLLELGL